MSDIYIKINLDIFIKNLFLKTILSIIFFIFKKLKSKHLIKIRDHN